MRITLHQPAAEPDWAGQADDIVDVPDAQAAELVGLGYATYTDGPPDPPVRAGLEPPETTERPPGGETGMHKHRGHRA